MHILTELFSSWRVLFIEKFIVPYDLFYYREEEEEDHCNFPYECSGSSSSLSSGSGSVSELYCSARPDKTYYRVQESFESGGRSTREDQATQTDDDEADICDNVTAVGPRQRPTSFKCGQYLSIVISLLLSINKIMCYLVIIILN